jgi:plasmid maintenance system killer protein
MAAVEVRRLTGRVNDSCRGGDVEILFLTSRLAKICNSYQESVKAYGPQRAKRLRLRLDQLRAAANLEVLRTLPGRCHELIGDRAGTLSIDLDGPYRLLLEPAETPPPLKADGGLDWNQVTVVRILKVEDTHG